jgi:radical SAM superfamily enzyme YgiQ (UPF0313 family)
MARIALINPPFLFWEERFQDLKRMTDATPALGLYSLAAQARRAGHEVLVVDLAVRPKPWPKALAEIVRFAPGLAGVSAVTVNVHHAGRIASDLKAALPGLPVVLGGPHGTALPKETLKRFPVFDAVALGEGEGTLLDLAAAVAEERPLSGVAGLALPGNGAPVRTAARALLGDLDSLELPAWDLLPGFPRGYSAPIFNFRRLPAASLITSRGCPLRCRFCDRSVFGNRIRFHSADYVLRMVERLADRYGVRHLIFFDDMFVANRARLEAIADGLARRPGRLSFSCNGRVGYMDKGVLATLKRAGCWQIAYGIESGDQRILDLIGKRQTLEGIEEAVRLAKEAGIRVKGLFMMGLPGETRETVWATARFARKLDLDLFQITKFTPLPGCEFYETARTFGEFDDDWTRMNMLNAVFVPRGMTARELDELFWTVNRHVYTRAGMAWKLAAFFLSGPDAFRMGVRATVEFFGNTLRRRLPAGGGSEPRA